MYFCQLHITRHGSTLAWHYFDANDESLSVLVLPDGRARQSTVVSIARGFFFNNRMYLSLQSGWEARWTIVDYLLEDTPAISHSTFYASLESFSVLFQLLRINILLNRPVHLGIENESICFTRLGDDVDVNMRYSLVSAQKEGLYEPSEQQRNSPTYLTWYESRPLFCSRL